jgi:hypothetical protein
MVSTEHKDKQIKVIVQSPFMGTINLQNGVGSVEEDFAPWDPLQLVKSRK